MLGRPEIYTEELGKEICRRLSLGESLLSICKNNDDMPATSTVYLWLLDEDKKTFSENYARARASQAEVMFDELLDIADDSSKDTMVVKIGGKEQIVENREFTTRSRLRVDTRKWYLSKVLPKKFGDKLDLTSNGKDLPTPILANVHRDDRDTKGTEAQ